MKYVLRGGRDGHHEIFLLLTSGSDSLHSQLQAPQLGEWDLSVSKRHPITRSPYIAWLTQSAFTINFSIWVTREQGTAFNLALCVHGGLGLLFPSALRSSWWDGGR